MGGSSARDSGSRRRPPISAAMPSGTLTRKIQRQSAASVSTPPITGPSTALSPMTGPKSPNAFCSSSAGKAARMMPKPWGIISAANAPWTRRKAISISVDCAAPHSAEAMVKPATPSRKSLRRPKMSPSRPPVTSPTANVSA